MLLALSNAKHVLPRDTIKYLIDALVTSAMRYCLSVFGVCGQTEKRRLQKLVNFAARVPSGRLKHQSIAEVLCHIRWLTAEQLIQYHRIMSVHRLVTHRVPAALAGTIGPPASRLHQHDTRDADSLSLPRIHTEAGRNRLCYSAVQGYNSERRTQGSVSRAAVKRHLRSERSAAGN